MYGGVDQLQEKSRDLYRYEISTGKWDILDVSGEKPPPLFGHASFVHDYYLYILLGNEMEGFESMNNMWRINLKQIHPTWEKIECKNLQPSVPRMNPSYIYHRNKLYVFGGYTYYGPRNDVLVMNLSILESKYPEFNWEILSKDMKVPPPRLGHAMVVHDEKLYIIGGKGKNRKK
jgi:N-acetylneuraminic acid mutarotase